MKSALDRIFVDGLGGMAQGLFATLIIGTIIQQIGLFVGGDTGNLIYLAGKMAAAMTGAGIGVGVARKFQADQLVVVSAATVGMIGAFAGKLLSGEVIQDGGTMVFAGPGEPLGAFVAAYIAIEIGILISGKTKLDIILTPLGCIGAGTLVGIFVGPPISKFMAWLGSLINWGTEQQPFLMGIVVSVLDGGAPAVDHVHLLLKDVHRRHLIVLSQQNRQRQPHIPCSYDCNVHSSLSFPSRGFPAFLPAACLFASWRHASPMALVASCPS